MMGAERLIYALRDPETDHFRYVGLSTRGMARPEEHLWRPRTGDRTHRANWLRGLLSRGVKPVIVVVEHCDTDEQLSAAEENWIGTFRAMGCPLTNHESGGFNGRPDAATRQKMSDAHRGERNHRYGHCPPNGEATRFKLGHTGKRPRSLRGAEHPMFGRQHTDESRQKMRDTLKGRTASNKGVPMSPEQRELLSRSRTGVSIKCSVCGERGHNRQTCASRKGS